MSEIVVRRAEPSDAEGIAAIYRSRSAAAGTLQNPYPSIAERAERLAADARLNYQFVALVDGVIVGNAGLHGMANARRAHAWGIGLAVHEDWQGKGVGTRLMEAMIDLADNWLGAVRIELTVYCDNQAALALYRRFGFTVEGTHRGWALRDGVYTDVLAMARINPRPPQIAPANAAT